MLRVLTIVVSLILLNPLFCFSKESQSIDSIESLMDQTHDISKKLELYIPLIRAYRNVDIIKAKHYANQALQVARGTNSHMFFGKIYGSLGDLAIAQDSVELARGYYEQALNQYEEKENLDGIGSV